LGSPLTRSHPGRLGSAMLDLRLDVK
jgi:hypothetical protein